MDKSTAPKRNVECDEIDAALRDRRLAEWNEKPGPRVGDFLHRADQTWTRFTHDWGDKLQTTAVDFGPGSFYFGDGFMEYSGALDPGVDKDRLEFTGEYKPGPAWIFHHNQPKAHNGVAIVVPCRVYREKHPGGRKDRFTGVKP